jgi:hypothetical protein
MKPGDLIVIVDAVYFSKRSPDKKEYYRGRHKDLLDGDICMFINHGRTFATQEKFNYVDHCGTFGAVYASELGHGYHVL